MKLHPAIIKALNEKVGMDVTTADGASRLRNDIESATGEYLSLNTVKRLTGVIAYGSEPRTATLDIIADYLGYGSHLMMMAAVHGCTSSFGGHDGMIEVSKLPVGTRIEMVWEPDRRVSIVHIGEGVCRVDYAVNSKLAEGDLLTLSQLADQFPLLVTNVRRDNRDMGPFTAGRQKGVTIKINP